jgi:drug/metabolite transporter (DMT)-like permease
MSRNDDYPIKENTKGRGDTYHMAKNMWLVLFAVVLIAYANVTLKFRMTVLAKEDSASFFVYIVSLLLDPWVWSTLIAAVITGVLYVITLRQLELSVLEPLFALVFILVPLAAVFILGEQLPPLRIVGLVLIFVGVILVGKTA